MKNQHTILLVIAAVCFFLAAIGMPTRRINMIALGLLSWVLSAVLPLL